MKNLTKGLQRKNNTGKVYMPALSLPLTAMAKHALGESEFFPLQKLTLHYISSLFVCVLILFTQCQPLTEEEPYPAKTDGISTNIQVVQTMDGNITRVECGMETLPSGELIQICVPANWNGELILYAPGYTSEYEPLHLAPEASVYGPLLTSFGYAFATTSYSKNGLAVLSGIEDIINLRQLFISRYRMPGKTFLTGASQGGIITTLAIERYPEIFNGGLSLCGPCGDFQRQINYYGDFRVLFDYFFPNVLPGDVLNLPADLIVNWEKKYAPAVLQAIKENPASALKLLNTAQAPFDPNNPATIAKTILDVLIYNSYLPNAEVVLGGKPYFNTNKFYFGTGSPQEDLKLNQEIKRYSADKAATDNIRNNYETTGDLKVPLVSAHTTQDPIDLFWHLPLYQYKTVFKGKGGLFMAMPVRRYGHCNFTEAEIITALSILLRRAGGRESFLFTNVINVDGKIVKSVTLER